MAPKTKSAIHGQELDIERLTREIHADVATYRQYKAEDGMKKRAIHSSKDYDEFRDFVSASQLIPTSGRDVSALFSGASGTVAAGGYSRNQKTPEGKGVIGGFEDVIQRRKDTSYQFCSVTKLDGDLQSLSLGKKTGTKKSQSSRAAHDFLREWKQHCKTANDTLAFLARVKDTTDGPFESNLILQPDSICKEYFATDLDSDVLDGIVEALHLLVSTNNGIGIGDAGGANDSTLQKSGGNSLLNDLGVHELLQSEANVLSFVDSWLKALATCGRFELSISFLASGQRQQLKDVCLYVESKGGKADSCEYYLRRYDSLLK